ncbi:MAG: Na+/H+ antiporter subunit D, partial [Rhodospirillaceae bacterium]|nr:Na+/H+ antiporter subunit D [Rhodospirillaceae bacterium]
MTAVPPGLALIAAAAVLPFLAVTARRAVLLAAPLVTLVLVWQVGDGPGPAVPLLGHALVPVAGSALGRLFATVFAVMAFGGALYGLTTAGTAELSAAFVYAGAAIGVSLAGDLVTLAVFWEVMAAASTVVIWGGGTAAARAAGLRYLMVHLMGGALLMAGVAMHAGAT